MANGFLRRIPALSIVALLAFGCSHQTPPLAVTAAQQKTAIQLAGVWDWVLSSTDEENNRRIEQEEWHLRQAQDVIDGFYVRTVTVVSGDDNLFRCNGQKRFQKRMRFHVQGRVIAGEVTLREVGVQVEPGPCGGVPHELQMYRGRWTGESLMLTWDAQHASGTRQRGLQVLYRRPVQTTDEEIHEAAVSQPAQVAVEPPAAQLSGTWTWEMRGLGWDGDAKIEQEEWHLTQSGNVIHGYYDRVVTSISTDGHPYRCNQQTQFATLTRYQVEGSISGNEVMLRELSFDAKPSQCEERPQRRLDAYQGNASNEEIVLVWGTGRQILKRTRPQVPTRSF